MIPAPSDVAALEDTLVSVLEKRPADAEVIVALGCAYDDPWNIREEVTFVQAPIGTPGLPKPASFRSLTSNSIATRRLCCVSTIRSFACKDLLGVVKIVNAAAITITATTMPIISSINVNPARTRRRSGSPAVTATASDPSPAREWRWRSPGNFRS